MQNYESVDITDHMKRLTNEIFLERANEIHNSKYIYHNDYKTSVKKIKITCKIHGDFYQTPANHIGNKRGCPKCSTGVLMTKDEFMKKCRKFHGDFYDYSLVDFKGVKKKVIIICPIHGHFQQIAEKHFLCGCQACGGNKRLTNESFTERSLIIHKNAYLYSKVEIINSFVKVIVVCKKHGDFLVSPSNHLRGKGCRKCASTFSHKESNWLDDIGVPDTFSNRNVKITVNGRKFNVDGYIAEHNFIAEFLGDFWHGNPKIYNLNDENKVIKKSFKVLLKNTIDKISFLRKNGFIVKTIWEDNYDKIIKKEKKKNETGNSRKSRKSKNNRKVSG